MALNTKTLAAGAAAMLALSMGVPMVAHAQSGNYDGYCYAKKGSKTTGTVVGAVAGGALGSQISKNERGLGTVAGAVLGGVIGNKVAGANEKCLNGEYYSYQSGYYSPLAAPDGYDVIYFKDRPDTKMYDVVYYDTRRSTSPRYANNNNGYNNGGYNNGNYSNTNSGVKGWRDDRGVWRTEQPVAFGWKDSKGRWHEGQVQAYGYRESNGTWRETNAPNVGYNNR
ncbi:hypothetical protein AEAC466_03605 [Asticcacaulis sp. AC466]|uniref:glycine zipper 2TM domain-containing protein n=1 Tax=Asticcacaulis sp. AC466 TaxID=1282362 RepID=UPI0003C3EF8C|nr:glycine zipper 2TM domain-containing protein [Asticcacaulis sp. AC466]ESQ86296.1 hypothetical protein AEAC466_03605 [Asticcacaulis sp. AC466]